MSKIYIDPEEDLFEILEEIFKSLDSDIEVMIDTFNPVLNNSLNLKYLEVESEKAGKKIKFVPKDEKGKEIIENFYKQSVEIAVDNFDQSAQEPSNQPSLGFVHGDILEQDREVVENQVQKKKFNLLKLFTMEKENKNAKKSQLIFRIITAVLLLLIPIGLFIVWWFLPVANISITLKSNSLDQAFTLAVSADVKEADIKAGVFPAQVVSVQKLLSQTANATGTRTIGENAEGVITISNKTSEEKAFPQGTLIELISEETLKKIQFTTTEPITVAASNSSVVGKSEVPIIASEIGEDYNLNSGKLFSVGGLDSTDFVAKNDNDFSGGFSKEVTVITQSDQDTLYSNIKSQLDKQVKDELLNKTKGKNLTKNSVNLTVIDKIFSDVVGTEANSFSLEVTEEAEGLVIDESTIQKLEQDIKPNVPDGYKLIEDKGEFSFDVIDSATAPQIIIQYKAKIGQVLSIEDLKLKLVGKTTDEARKIIKESADAAEYSIRITPKLPPALTRMPRLQDRINIQVEYKDISK